MAALSRARCEGAGSRQCGVARIARMRWRRGTRCWGSFRRTTADRSPKALTNGSARRWWASTSGPITACSSRAPRCPIGCWRSACGAGRGGAITYLKPFPAGRQRPRTQFRPQPALKPMRTGKWSLHDERKTQFHTKTDKQHVREPIHKWALHCRPEGCIH